MSYPALRVRGRHVGVVITARNCARELPATISSMLAQTLQPKKIVVVEDDSNEDTEICRVVQSFGLNYSYINKGKGLTGNYARNHGVKFLSAVDYYCFIDGDGDYVPPDYLQKCVEALEADCRAAVAYPRLQLFGEQVTLIHPDFSRDTLRRTNIAPVASLVCADAFHQVGGWPIVSEKAHDDWALWQRIVEHGWKMTKADTTYYWRRHANSMSANKRVYHEQVDQTWNWCTVAIPFAGRDKTLHKLLQAIYQQTIPRQQLSFLFYDTSGDQHFRHRLRDFLIHLDGADIRYVKDWRRTVPEQTNQEACDGPYKQRPGPAINHRVAGIWNRIGQLVTTPYVWCLEDDVIPPPYCLERLWATFNPETDGVTAVYRNRDGRTWNVGRFSSLSPLTGEHVSQSVGPEACHVTQMGCVLLRTELLRTPARSAGTGPDGYRWYDWNYAADWARQGKRLVANWDVVCEHLTGV